MAQAAAQALFQVILTKDQKASRESRINIGIPRAYTYRSMDKIGHMSIKGTVSAKWIFRPGR